MQFDQTQITIRERGFLEILDLALHVLRSHWGPLSVALGLGVFPFALLNYWWIGDLVQQDVLWDESNEYLFTMGWLVVGEIPLATAPLTLYLGQVTFHREIELRAMVRDYFRSLPQLIVLQGMVRALLTFLMVTLLFPYLSWPYLNEIILLERNPLWGRKGKLTTMRRSRNLHGGSSGQMLGRWAISLGLAAILCTSLTFALATVAGILRGQGTAPHEAMLLWCPLAIWLVAGFFAVVRFLAYLDLRIRREGWEVELSLRAEAERLAEGVAT